MYDYSQRAEEGGEHMSPSERRQKILEVLCARRHDTCENLAREFNVCQRTIRYDIEELMCTYPIETVCGRYGGGIKIADGFYLGHSPYQSKTLNQEQTALLNRLKDSLSGNDRRILTSILNDFAL